MQLQAGTAQVRLWRMQDAAELAAEANDRRIWRALRDAFPHPYSLEDARQFLSMTLDMRPQTFFAIERERRVVGGIGYAMRLDVERVSAEIGYWLGVRHWGHGIATDAVRAVTRQAFTAHPQLQRLFAVPFTSNSASARVLQKAGYTLEGTLRSSAIKEECLLDQWMYSVLRSEI